jgi:hypothetical protein
MAEGSEIVCWGETGFYDNLYTLACRRRRYKLLQTSIDTILISGNSTLSKITVTEKKKHTSDRKLAQEK